MSGVGFDSIISCIPRTRIVKTVQAEVNDAHYH